jgi:hypothetical protein
VWAWFWRGLRQPVARACRPLATCARFITGLLLTLVAQSALSGVLAPVRETISGLWLISGPSRDLMQVLGLSTQRRHVPARSSR